jgi:hypothetical protein
MSLAIGGSPAPARPPHGTLWVDVRDYGAKADSGLTDNSGPIQAAIDALGAMIQSLGLTRGIVYIPGAPQAYVVYKSIWVDHNNIEIQGDGWGTVVTMTGSNKMPVFIFGIERVQYYPSNGSLVPIQVDATYRPDTFGKLDTSAAPAAGVKWGLRTNGNSFAQFQGGPISAGVASAAGYLYSDLWSETSKLTVEFCCEPPDGQQFPLNAPLLGIGTIPYEPSPFTVSIWDDPNKVMVVFRTSDMPTGSSNNFRLFTFSLAGANPPYRIAIQFDLENAVLTAFVNGVQVPLGNLDPAYLAPPSYPFTPQSGLKFVTNDHFPFMIGMSGINGSYGGASPVDLRVYGLRLSNTLRYQNNGPGQRQVRTDAPATAVNDAFAYFGSDANTICFLQGTDNPTTSGRVVSVQHGNVAVYGGISSGLIIHTIGGPGTVSNNAIRDICVQGSHAHGQVITIGSVLEMTIENVKAFDGFHGIGSFIMGASYNIYLRNCWLAGADAGYFGAIQLMYAREIMFGGSGRVTMRHVGVGARWDSVFVSEYDPVCECIFKARSYPYGGNYSITNLLVDFEGPTISRAAIFCEAHAGTPATSLLLKDIFFGTIGSSASLVMLNDVTPEGGDFHKCYLSVENMQVYSGPYLSAIDVDGPLWCGEVSGVALTGPPINHRRTFGTTTRVVIREIKYVAPPRVFLWYYGAHVLEVRSPADGQFSEWRCVGTGSYGTSNPPAWLGLNPLVISSNGLAAYVLNHAYMTVSLK